MDNRIRQLKVRDGQLIPAQAEVWISVVPEFQSATTEVRGRLMGPCCPYAGTVEVAYPLRPPPPEHTPPGSPGITMRVVIPEASMWEPESPFLYQGPIELWQDGVRCDQVGLSHGLRSFHLGEGGLRVNSRPLTLRGRHVAACSDADALLLRQTGCNLLVAPIAEDTLALWDRADRYGFFVLGRVRDDSEQTRGYLKMASRHPSCLGWLIEEKEHPPLDFLRPGLLGLLCDSTTSQFPLEGIDFLVSSMELANRGKPLLVTGEVPDPPPGASLIFGSIV